VDPVDHPVRLERAPDLPGDLLVGRDLLERARPGRVPETIEMLGEAEDPPLVEPQPLPHRVASLHCAVERADPGFVAMDEIPVHVDDQITIAFVERLEHDGFPVREFMRRRRTAM